MGSEQDRATDAMMAVSRTMTAVVARTFGEVASEITVPQLRVLVLLKSRGPMNLSTVAQHLSVNPSNASRTCDQLVSSGRVVREAHERDRRNVVLRLTDEGARFVEGLMAARRAILEGVIARMAPADQEQLAASLEAFSAAVASAPADETIGLPDGRIIPWLL
ncbi:MarR family winged helix-turn-helix transcriptional regulator [Nocardioides sp. SYSU DS0663]|uniref:MarR family winged helix-turn-helix transcriptional regulator n=1 Tax=Nocardioides sp. SYSU DS0663 TaxID=3416445 RepID=UPI003F4BC1B8